MTVRDFKKCPDDCPYACDGWCQDDVHDYAHCPTVDRFWKRYAIGEFGELIHVPKGVSEALAKERFYRTRQQSQPKAASVATRKAAFNPYDEE